MTIEPIKQLHIKNTLNPYIFDDDKIKDDVRLVLLNIAMDFYTEIKSSVKDLSLVGVHLVGSNANYNYTQWSDIDVHLVFDMSNTEYSDLVYELMIAKKIIWNTTHEKAHVKGFPVEVYPEREGDELHSKGIYNLVKNDWVILPSKDSTKWDDAVVEAKYFFMKKEIHQIIHSGEENEINDMFNKIKRFRKSGLVKSGEMSVENLTYKALRNGGIINKLAMARLAAEDKKFTLEETPEGGLARCTVQTVNAFAEFYRFPPISREYEIPIYNVDVVNYLTKQRLKMEPVVNAQGMTVQQFVNSHRRGTYYISTDGHAMALINGNLVDAEQKGADSRRIVSAIEFRR